MARKNRTLRQTLHRIQASIWAGIIVLVLGTAATGVMLDRMIVAYGKAQYALGREEAFTEVQTKIMDPLLAELRAIAEGKP